MKGVPQKSPSKSPSVKGASLKSASLKSALLRGALSKAAFLRSASSKSASSKGASSKGASLKGAKDQGGKGDPKKVAPAVPPRKIQVVQMTSLKPGARGTKASIKRQPALAVDGSAAGIAKKRRSAELTKQQLDHFSELLMQRRTRLSHDLSLMQDEALKVTTQDNSSDSVADTGTDNYEQDFTLGLIESEEALAREVDQALQRIGQNAFGVCESCQTPIPLARLEILPFARYCVDCQQKREVRG